MGINCEQYGQEWDQAWRKVDGMIIASAAKSHCEVATRLLHHSDIPLLIEKPVCMSVEETQGILEYAEYTFRKPIIFTGHTRLYSPSWREFKVKVGKPETVFMQYGGPSKLGWLWD